MRSSCLIVIALLLATRLAGAGPIDLAAQVEALSSPDPAERQAAGEALRELSPGDLPALRDAVAALPEPRPSRIELPLRRAVRYAHLSAARDRASRQLFETFDMARPFLGVQGLLDIWEDIRLDFETSAAWLRGSDPGLAETGFVIRTTLDGFPAAPALRPGDVIVSITVSRRQDGPVAGVGLAWSKLWPVRHYNDLRDAIGDAAPFDVIRVRVLRGGRFAEHSIRLAAGAPDDIRGWGSAQSAARSTAESEWNDQFAPLFANE